MMLSLGMCATTQHVSDSYCAAYRRVIVAPGEGAEVSKTSRTVRNRIASNEILYRCSCENWQNPICTSSSVPH